MIKGLMHDVTWPAGGRVILTTLRVYVEILLRRYRQLPTTICLRVRLSVRLCVCLRVSLSLCLSELVPLLVFIFHLELMWRRRIRFGFQLHSFRFLLQFAELLASFQRHLQTQRQTDMQTRLRQSVSCCCDKNAPNCEILDPLLLSYLFVYHMIRYYVKLLSYEPF